MAERIMLANGTRLAAGDAASVWPTASAVLRRALAAEGCDASAIELVLAGVEPLFKGLERHRGAVEPDLALVLCMIVADRDQRFAGA